MASISEARAPDVNTTYEPPFLFARRMSTLDHLTKGRIGWNIVTGYLDSAARSMGLARQPDHDARYEAAEEYLEVLYKLWEGSWADDAVRRDREGRVFADPARVRAVLHEGRHYRVDGIHLSEPSPQRTPVLFQAGASSRGQEFAARHAECVFIASWSPKSARELVDGLRRRAIEFGRPVDAIKVLNLVTVVTGRTEREAQEKLKTIVTMPVSRHRLRTTQVRSVSISRSSRWTNRSSRHGRMPINPPLLP